MSATRKMATPFYDLKIPVRLKLSALWVSAMLCYVMLITMLPGRWMFYLFLGVVEIALALLIVWYAWNWPLQAPDGIAIGDGA